MYFVTDHLCCSVLDYDVILRCDGTKNCANELDEDVDLCVEPPPAPVNTTLPVTTGPQSTTTPFEVSILKERQVIVAALYSPSKAAKISPI